MKETKITEMFPLFFSHFLLVQNTHQNATPVSHHVKIENINYLSTDSRLTNKVTISESEITINKLLEGLSNDSGVPLKMRDSKKMGEYKVCVFAKEVEIYRLLEALEAMFRYKHVSTEWGKTVTGDGYALSTGAQDFLVYAKRTKKEANEKFLRDVKNASTLLNKNKEDLNTLSNNGKALTGSDWVAGVIVFHDDYKDTWYRDGLNAFFHGLSKEEQDNVLAGKPLDIANPSTNKYFSKLSFGDNPETVPPKASKLTFKVESGGFAPVLSIYSDGRGHNYVGNQYDEKAARDSLIEDWYTRYEQRTDPKEEQIIAASADEKPMPENETHRDGATRVLAHISEVQNIPVIVLLPPPPQGVMIYGEALPTQKPLKGEKVGSILERFVTDPFVLNHKWINGVLVLRDPVAPFLEALKADAPSPQPVQIPRRNQ